jgi:hypothetical protein
MKPLEYLRILTEPTEDTRRVVCLREPTVKPDERGELRQGQWRGKARSGGGVQWQTLEVWGQDIVTPAEWGVEGIDWHSSNRQIAVDVEAAAGAGPPEPWWREFFGGLRGRKRKLAQPGSTELLKWDMGSGTGASFHTQSGDSEYYGSRRSPCFLRIYLKYQRPGIGRQVRQVHLDTWTRAGWTGGAVYRVEAVLSPPTELGLSVTARELFADAGARVRLLEHPPEGRGCNVPTAERWERLTHPLKLGRPEDTAPDEKAAKLRRALARLAAEHGDQALRLGVMLLPDRRESVEQAAIEAERIKRLTASVQSEE